MGSEKSRQADSSEKFKNIGQFLKFCLVGVSNVVVCEGIYVLLLFMGVHYLVANIFGNLISILNAYFWSNRFVFKAEQGEKRVWWKVLAKTYASYGFSIALSAGLLVFWLELVQLSQFMEPVLELLRAMEVLYWLENAGLLIDTDRMAELLAEAINLVITIPINFLVNKFWTYRKQK
ncbi:MAG: GtrA family protein [Lachnospiraceae bacterium]|nr:GtrA family protein [Lachnospiraceae bacterium]